jgi:hypothetical protein
MPHHVRPFVPAIDVAWLTQNGTIDGRIVQCSQFFHYTAGGLAAPQLDSLANAMGTWYGASLYPYTSSDLGIVSTIAVRQNVQSDIASFSIPFSSGGGPLGPGEPNNVGFRIDFKSAVDVRFARGWNTLFGVPKSVTTLSRVNPSWAAGVVAAYNLLPGVVGPLGFVWVIVSRRIAHAYRPAAVITPVTLAVAKDLVVDSARHRLPNRRFT